MRVALVDAGGANLGSVRYALNRLGIEPEVTVDAEAIRAADRVVLPGVSTAAQVMGRLHALDLVQVLRGLEAPLLGVCVGMQLLYERSEEGGVECLGLLPGVVRKLPLAPGIRVPHMGWNGLRTMRGSALLDGVAEGASAYFVHSYAAPITADTVAATDHGSLFSSVVQRGRLCGAQFHPERSAATGARILRNFVEMDF
ncbi:imidazole glycerol phosphate synthase subunit HisH [Pseudoxanthomonas daejeonensis]